MDKKRIVILGGGMGSMTTAFELTDRAGWSDDYEVTVYQTGWRLGGKCASGRNREMFDRIEEHGLHLLFGFYDNVFRIMKRAYDELGRPPGQPLATWQDAFKPHDLVVMMEQCGGEYVPWEVSALRNDREPGSTKHHATPFEYLLKLLAHAVERYGGALGTVVDDATAVADVTRTLLELARSAGAKHPALASAIASLLHRRRGGGVELVFLEVAHFLARTSPRSGRTSALDPGEHHVIPWLLREFLSRISQRAKGARRELRRVCIELDFMLTMAIGLIADKLVDEPVDWFKINDADITDWLRRHGAAEDTLRSPLIAGIYDAIFSTGTPVAAGTAVHLILLMVFEYKGALLYKMQAGMGDTVFSPLYEVLRRRGVKFEFFHTVTNVAPSRDGRSIGRIELGIQATLKHPGTAYDPLIDVKGLPCWPSTPDFDQLEQGEALKARKIDLESYWTDWQDVSSKTLEAGRDFDTCVLGISIAALPYICKELIDRDERWQRMVHGVTTCQTSAVQLWMTESLEQTGWQTRSKEPPVVIPYVEPLDTWCVMNQLIDKERWPPEYTIGSLHYLCSRLPDTVLPLPPKSDHEYPRNQARRVQEAGRSWLERFARGVWPRATVPGHPDQFDWQWLVDPANRTGPQRFDAQYCHAVSSPSERYVLSVPGDTRVRLRPDDSGYANLVLAGDWTLNALSAGCLEATAMSGIMAATAVDGHQRAIAYDWLPRRAPAQAAPPYLRRGGMVMPTPPIVMDMTLYMFLLESDMTVLNTLCDTYLNLGGDVVYRPVAPFVCLYCSSADSSLANVGHCPERDFGFWVPVMSGRMAGTKFVPEKLLTFTPYLWVDSGAAMVGGREVFGFPKQLGKLVMPEHLSEAPSFSIDTLVIPEFSSNAHAVQARVLEVQRSDASIWETLQHAWRDAAGILAGIEGLFAGHGAGRIARHEAALFLRMLRERKHDMPMVFLKEFPSAAADGRACYQALVEASVKVTSHASGGLLHGQYDVDLWSFASLPMAAELGLRGEQDGNRTRLSPFAQMWMKFDAEVCAGKVVYARGGAEPR